MALCHPFAQGFLLGGAPGDLNLAISVGTQAAGTLEVDVAGAGSGVPKAPALLSPPARPPSLELPGVIVAQDSLTRRTQLRRLRVAPPGLEGRGGLQRPGRGRRRSRAAPFQWGRAGRAFKCGGARGPKKPA